MAGDAVEAGLAGEARHGDALDCRTEQAEKDGKET
jgi:hypothetical protein